MGEAGWGRALRILGLGGSDRNAPAGLTSVPPNPWPGDATRGRAMMGNVITLAGETVTADGSPWDAPAGAPWVAALHSFDWLRDMKAVGGDVARRHSRALTTEWLDRNQRKDESGAAPEVMGARLANWIGFHDFFCASADDEFRARLFTSLNKQARTLARALPGDLVGAPLLTAIKGLLATGLCVAGGESRQVLAEKLLLNELPNQILADGCHIERSPAVHAAVLASFIDIRAMYKTAQIGMPEALQNAIDRMTPALRFLRHGDGGLALFNGSQEGEKLLLDTVLAQADAKGRPLKRAEHAGFDRITMGRTVMVVDTGAIPPPKLDQQAHASIASFELSIGRERFVVNCGAQPSGPWRAALAGTAAHSTVTVADTNQIELMPGGGLSRRPHEISSRREDSPEGSLIEVTHDGYRHLGVLHRRTLFIAHGGEDIRGDDTLSAATGKHFVIRFHLHPDVQASLAGEGCTALLRLGDGTGWRFRSDSQEIALEDGVYLGTGNTPRRTQVLVIAGITDTTNDTSLRWAFHREKRPTHISEE